MSRTSTWRSDTFFRRVFGFEEDEYSVTRDKLIAAATFTAPPTGSVAAIASLPTPAERCVFTIGGRRFDAGIFFEPSVAELRTFVSQRLADPAVRGAVSAAADKARGQNGGSNVVTVANLVGESKSLHLEPRFAGAVFQAASQFNYLEFPSPGSAPEQGIGGYAFDRTQGPACAIACAAGTAYRNYLLPPLKSDAAVLRGLRGQRKDYQRNGILELETVFLAHVAAAPPTDPTLPIAPPQLPWRVKSGYIEASPERLLEANRFMGNAALVSTMRSALRVGVQLDTVVINKDQPVHSVSQVYCSAVSCGYSRCPTSSWMPLASLVLDASYEATYLVAVVKAIDDIVAGKEPAPLLLTKVGGGVFANEAEWIQHAIRSGAKAVAALNVPLSVFVVHYGSIESGYENSVVAKWSA